MTLDLPMIWAALIAFAVLAYVLLDGFDLGVGILFPLIKGESNRDEAMNSVAPVWDGNETWLVLGVGILRVSTRRPVDKRPVLPDGVAPCLLRGNMQGRVANRHKNDKFCQPLAGDVYEDL